MTIPATNVTFSALATETEVAATNISLNNASIRAFSDTASATATQISVSSFLNKTAEVNYLSTNATSGSGLTLYKTVRNTGQTVPKAFSWQSFSTVGTFSAAGFPSSFTPDGTVLAVFNGTVPATTKQMTLFTKSSAGVWAEATTTLLDATVSPPYQSYPVIAWDSTGTYLGLGGGVGYGTGASADYIPGYFMKRSGTTLTVMSSPTTTINTSNHNTYGPVVWSPVTGTTMFLVGNASQSSGAGNPLSRYNLVTSTDTFTYVADSAPTPPDGSRVLDMAFSSDGSRFFIAYVTWSDVYTYRTYTVSGQTFTLANTYTADAAVQGFDSIGSGTYTPTNNLVIQMSDTNTSLYSYVVSVNALSTGQIISQGLNTFKGKWVDNSYIAQGNSTLTQYSLTGTTLSSNATIATAYSPQSSTSKAVSGQQ